jgi:hypothetical protein
VILNDGLERYIEWAKNEILGWYIIRVNSG